MQLSTILKTTFSPQEIDLLRKALKISIVIFVVLALAGWSIQYTLVKRGDKEKPIVPPTPSNDIFTLYSEKSKDLMPIDIEAHLAAFKARQNDSTPYVRIQHLLRIIAADKNNREVKLLLGIEYMKAGMFKEAEIQLQYLLDEQVSDSISAPALAKHGLTLCFTGTIDQSIAELDKCIKEFPQYAEAYCFRGQVEAMKNSESKNIAKFLKKAVEINPRFSEGWYQLARYYMNKPHPTTADYNEARKFLNEQIALEPLNAKTHARLGMIYYYLDQPEIAEKSYKTALLLNANDYNTHYNLGELYYLVYKNSSQAAEEFKKTVEIKPDHAEAYFKIGLICLEKEMVNEAVSNLELAHKYDGTNVRILLQLGVAYERAGNSGKAIATYNAILSLDALNDIALHKIRLLSSRKE